ncbi:MAG: hypothetical protein GY940_34455 [bacterium]|nr:hypothetical protein [bacterium]
MKTTMLKSILLSIIISVSLSGLIPAAETKVTIESHGWKLIGDLNIPGSDGPVPAVILLNKAAGNRMAYAPLAAKLAEKGIASLRVDLRGHGESINLGKFVPGKTSDHITQSDMDVLSVHNYIKSIEKIDKNRIGIVGASYTGEAAAVTGKDHGYAKAYVILSSGNFSGESIKNMDKSGVPWWHITSKEDRYLKEIIAEIKKVSKTAKVTIVDGTKHATDLLIHHPVLNGAIAKWFEERLK